MAKIRYVFVQLGSPRSLKTKDVRSYLKEFLGDPRVVDFNPFFWKIILNLFILPFRPKKSGALYGRIWTKEGSPLIVNTEKFCEKVRNSFKDGEDIRVDCCYILSSPRLKDIVDVWEKEATENPDLFNEKWVFIPLFPQYSESTSASVFDVVTKEFHKRVNIPQFEFIQSFYRWKFFLERSVEKIDSFLDAKKKEGKEVNDLILSFHGIPKRRVIYKKDLYYRHCYETFLYIRDHLKSLKGPHIHLTFQSRFGSEEWLTPYTEEYTTGLVKEKRARGDESTMAIYSPSFVADCLETLDELGNELREEVEKEGGEIFLIPCLNDDNAWCGDWAHFLEKDAQTRVESYKAYELNILKDQEMPKVEMKQRPLSESSKKTLKIVFLTLFLDLIGFSIIFPLFPALAKYYLTCDSDNMLLNGIFKGITALLQVGNVADKTSAVVLFGGALGALYSFLQFLAAPLWGGISDKIGRRPVLLLSVGCLALSYLLWFFSGSFTLLVISRFVGGIMGGNISTATAVVADVTDSSNRSKGMAFIGIAFAFGFIFGPAIGGLASLVDLTKWFPSWQEFGVNPFSTAALIALILSLVNLYGLWKYFKETLPEGGSGEKSQRIIGIDLFRPLPYKGVNLVNLGYFFFLSAFSGMEFTLTFLAFDRLGYSPAQNGLLFVFIGFVLALVQGGFVRRKASSIGEKKVVILGLLLTIPGLVILSFAHSSLLLYAGLFFLAVGSAMIIPCMTSLVSLLLPREVQGRGVGIFRSLGALARVIGPLLASVIYWRQGASSLYLLGAVVLLLPILLILRLDENVDHSSESTV